MDRVRSDIVRDQRAGTHPGSRPDLYVVVNGGVQPDDVVYLYSHNDPFENMSLHFPKRLMSKPGAYLDEDGNLRFRALTYPVGIYDAEALFVEPSGGVGTLPVLGHGWLDRLDDARQGLGARMARRVVVTGLGAVSSIGIGAEAFGESLRGGRLGITRLRGADTLGLPF